MLACLLALKTGKSHLYKIGGWWLLSNNDEDLISTYFCIQERIDKGVERIEQYKVDFNTKNFYTCIQSRYDEMTTVAFNIEREVTNHVSSIEMAEHHIKTLRFKLKHFKRFWSGLSSSDKEYYVSRYKYMDETFNDRLDRLISEEAAEIEEAIRYRFGGVEPEQVIQASDSNENMNQMLKILGV